MKKLVFLITLVFMIGCTNGSPNLPVDPPVDPPMKDEAIGEEVTDYKVFFTEVIYFGPTYPMGENGIGVELKIAAKECVAAQYCDQMYLRSKDLAELVAAGLLDDGTTYSVVGYDKDFSKQTGEMLTKSWSSFNARNLYEYVSLKKILGSVIDEVGYKGYIVYFFKTTNQGIRHVKIAYEIVE